MQENTSTQSTDRMLTFREGGWVILLALLLVIAIATWALFPAITRGPAPPPAQTPDDFGFDLTNLTVPKDELTVALLRKDSLPKWDHPPLVPSEAIAEQIRFGRKKYLVSTDRVVGLTINDTSRCYPISVLTVHEIINDTVAGVPIAVTYHPWCDSVVVFERTLNGETIELGSSGLLIDSNMILYDRNKEAGSESLFRQLTGRAIAGPAVTSGASLTMLPITLTTWADWHTTHPATQVIGWDESLVKRYEGSSPDQYFRSPELAFPVDPLPPANTAGLKERIIAVTVGGDRRVFPESWIAEHADQNHEVHETIGAMAIALRYDPDHRSVVLKGAMPSDDVHVIYALWFAWFAAHGDADVVGYGEQASEASAEAGG